MYVQTLDYFIDINVCVLQNNTIYILENICIGLKYVTLKNKTDTVYFLTFRNHIRHAEISNIVIIVYNYLCLSSQ